MVTCFLVGVMLEQDRRGSPPSPWCYRPRRDPP